MFHRIILVLTLFSAIGLVAVGCTGSDTVREIETVKIKCENGDLIDEGEECPQQQQQQQQQQTPAQDSDDDDDDTRSSSDCKLVRGGQDFIGSSGDDDLCGDDKANRIYGADGRDTIDGKGDNDLIKGGEDDDILKGGPGNDRLYGGEGQDILDGGDDDDTLFGGEDDDTFKGGGGTDTVSFATPRTEDAIEGETPEERPDAADLETIEIDLAQGFGIDEWGDQDSYEDIENLIGSSAVDKLRGDGKANRIDGGGGADVIEARGGDDTVVYDATDTTINGGPGEDTLIVSVATFNLETDTTTEGFENLTGSAEEEVNAFTGNEEDNILKGEGGADNLEGGGGTDTLYGGPGGDCFNLDASESSIDTIADFGEGDSIHVANISTTAVEDTRNGATATRTPAAAIRGSKVVIILAATTATGTNGEVSFPEKKVSDVANLRGNGAAIKAYMDTIDEGGAFAADCIP